MSELHVRDALTDEQLALCENRLEDATGVDQDEVAGDADAEFARERAWLLEERALQDKHAPKD